MSTGGVGTWDELLEMACLRNVGFFSKPIVAVNVDGFYDGTYARVMLLHTVYSD